MKSLLDKVNTKLNAQGGFLKAASLLVGGTAFAQIIGLICLPIITRLYTPIEFSIFSVYLSSVSIFAVIACMRFELAIPVQESDDDAIAVVILSIFCNIFFTIFLTLILIIFGSDILAIFNKQDLEKYMWVVPLGVFLSGIYSAFQYWSIRKKNFSLIATTRLIQAISSSSIQISGGFLGLGPLGLILGQLFNFFGGSFKLIISFFKENLDKIKSLNKNKIIFIFLKNKDYPKYSITEGFLSSLSIHFPIIIIFMVLPEEKTGLLMLAIKVMMIPMILIGSAMSQLYLGDARNKYNNNKLWEYTFFSLKKIIFFGVFPLIIISFLSPYLFPFIFGQSWKGAGELVLILLPWFIMQLLTSPISMALHILNRQKVAMIIQVIGFVFRVIGLLGFSYINSYYVIEYYAISSMIFYLVYFLIIIYLIFYEGKRVVNESQGK